jgi:hypothetical protein
MSTSEISSLVVVVQEQPSVVEVMAERTLVVDATNPAQVVEVIAPPVETLAVVMNETVTVLQSESQGPAGALGNLDLGEFF